MTEFTPLQSLLGGGLIGLSAVLLMAFHGRIAGMTGVLAGLLPGTDSRGWRIAFLIGAIAAPALRANGICMDIHAVSACALNSVDMSCSAKARCNAAMLAQ